MLEGLGSDENGMTEQVIEFARMVRLDSIFIVVGLKEDAKNKQKASSKPSGYVDDYLSFTPSVKSNS